MNDIVANFRERGFGIIPDVLSAADLDSLPEKCDGCVASKPGSRNLLMQDWIRNLAASVSDHPEIFKFLPAQAVAVQCTYFSKSHRTNWLVPSHRDTSIPVKRKFSAPGWSGWSVKEGVHFVHAPKQVLQSLVAVRLHFEHNTEENGALRVVPGSHLDDHSAA